MHDWQKIVSHLSNQYKDVNKRVRPSQTNATRWWSKYKTVRTVIQSTSSFLAYYISLLNLNEGKKSLKWSKNQIESITNLLLLWNDKPANIGILYGVHIILERLNITMNHLQTSGLTMRDVKPSILSCYDYLEALCDDKNGILTDLVENSRMFTKELMKRFKADITQQLLTKKRNGSTSQLIMSMEHTKMVREQIQIFLKALLKGMEKRVLNDFTENNEYFDQMTMLSPSNVTKINDDNADMSVNFLCTLAKLDECTTKLELKGFAEEFKSLTTEMMSFVDYENEDENDNEDENEAHEFMEKRRKRIEWVLLSEFFFN